MVAPGYLAFVSKLAPKEKVSAYIGCNFLASFTGIFFGALIFGILTNIIAVGTERPHFFYGVVITVGLLILVGFMFYYRAWGKEIIERAAKIKSEEEGIHIDEAREVHHEPFYLKFFDKRKSVIVPLMIIPIILFATFSVGTTTFYPPEDGDGTTVKVIFTENSTQIGLADYTNEGSSTSTTLETQGILTWINVTFSWNDNEPAPRLQTNLPDEFEIELQSPNGTVESAGPSESGALRINYQVNETESIGGSDWNLVVSCVNAGDIVGPLGFVVRSQDAGNDWTATVRISYLEELR
jgi:hypothetical protein